MDSSQSAKPVYTMKGVSDLLEVYEDKVAITPKGVMGFLTKGTSGMKTIPFASISNVQFKKPWPVLKRGYFQFIVSGGNGKGYLAASYDQNTFMYAEQEKLALQINAYVEKRMESIHRPQVLP